MKSSFQFRGYKIDRFDFKVLPAVGLLNVFKIEGKEEYDIKIGFGLPQYFKKERIYVSGLELLLNLKPPQETQKKENIFELKAGITGAFYVENELDKNLEQNLVKYQIPALLMPYLRASITSFLSNAGFSGFILPLFNIYQLAKDQMKDIEIVVK